MKTKSHTGSSPLLVKEGCLKGGVVKTLLLCFSILVISACHSSKTTTSSNYQKEVQDSTLTNTLRHEIDSLTNINTRFRTLVFEKASELATLLQGSTGEQDTTCDIPIREKLVRIGEDHVKVRGQWHFLDYEIYKAPSQSTSTTIKDSSSASSDNKSQLLQKNLNEMFHSSAEKEFNDSREVIYRVPFKFYLIAAGACIAFLLIGKFVW